MQEILIKNLKEFKFQNFEIPNSNLVVNFKIRNDIKNVVSDFVFVLFKVLEFEIYLLEFEN
jgi:hypothetical protein